MKNFKILSLLLTIILISSFSIPTPFERINFVNNEKSLRSDSLDLEESENLKDAQHLLHASITNYDYSEFAIKIFNPEFVFLNLSSPIYLKNIFIHSPPLAII